MLAFDLDLATSATVHVKVEIALPGDPGDYHPVFVGAGINHLELQNVAAK